MSKSFFTGCWHLSPGYWIRNPVDETACLWQRIATDRRVKDRSDRRVFAPYHLGPILPDLGLRPSSLEGPGLSVTTMPDLISEIEGCSPYPRSKLIPKRGFGRLLDLYDLEESPLAKELTRQAVQENLLKPQKVGEVEVAWLAPELPWPPPGHGDPAKNAKLQLGFEMGVWEWTRLENIKAAIWVSDFLDKSWTENAFRVVDGFVPGAEFMARWNERFSDPPPLTILEELAWLQLIEATGKYDGVWWRELPSVEAGSFPRGVIFESKLENWDLTTYEIAEDDPTTMEEELPHDSRSLLLQDA